MIRCFIEAYPWDLTHAGADAVLAALRGEVGVTGLAVWAAAPPVTTFRIRDWQPRVFRSRGGLYFQPTKDRYERTRCRPLISSWTHEGERFHRIAAACERHGLQLRLILSAAAVGRLAEHYPEFAARNLFGVESASGLCLGNPDVQEYLVSVIADVTAQYAPAGVVLSDFAVTWREAFQHEFSAGVLGDVHRRLMGVCFCVGCRQQAEEAGVDAGGAAEQAGTLLQSAFIDGAPPLTFDEVCSGNPAFAEYLCFQQERLHGLAHRLIAAGPCEVLIQRELHAPHTCGVDRLDSGAPGAILTAIRRSEDLDQIKLGRAARSELSVPASMAASARAPELVSTIQRAATMGISGVQIAHFGLLADPMLSPIKQAIRFARRTAE